jgi:hypothetical protein
MEDELFDTARRAIQNKDIGLWVKTLTLLMRSGATLDEQARNNVSEALCQVMSSALMAEGQPPLADGGASQRDRWANRYATIEEAVSALKIPASSLVAWKLQVSGVTKYSLRFRDVVNSLDRIFGPLNWGMEIDDFWCVDSSPAPDCKTFIAKVTLTVTVMDGKKISRQSVGTDVRRSSIDPCWMAMGVEAAVKNAFKSAARTLGEALREPLEAPERSS